MQSDVYCPFRAGGNETTRQRRLRCRLGFGQDPAKWIKNEQENNPHRNWSWNIFLPLLPVAIRAKFSCYRKALKLSRIMRNSTKLFIDRKKNYKFSIFLLQLFPLIFIVFFIRNDTELYWRNLRAFFTSLSHQHLRKYRSDPIAE